MLMGWTKRDRGTDADHVDAWGGIAPGQIELTFAEGIVSGNLIATESGWVCVEAISAGDKVLTFDNGVDRVLDVSRKELWNGRGACPRVMWPLAVPAGALGNCRAMLVLPYQNVMLESDMAEELFGDPFALVPASALEGYRGITRVCPAGKIEIISMRFAEDQVVYSNGSGMLHCGSIDGLGLTIDFVISAGPYAPLPYDRARKLVALMADAESVA